MEAVTTKAAPDFECTSCKRRFERKTSLVRHLKICRNSNVNPRQRSCGSCSSAKSKCDLQRPSRGRCTYREILCTYKHSQRSSQAAFTRTSASQSDPENSGPYATPADSTHGIQAVDALEHDPTLLPATDDVLAITGLVTLPPQPSIDEANGLSFASLMDFFSEDNEAVSRLYHYPLLEPYLATNCRPEL
ncbi:hypothetical protein BDV12DRAFT_200673 [Aspergillus spectabilis]